MMVQDVTGVRTEVLKVVSYYHIFRHPLRFDEIYRFMHVATSEKKVKDAIETLLEDGLLFYYNGYYAVEDKMSLVIKRIAGETRAKTQLVKANSVGRFISYFPFVRFVGISGSLSKNYADDHTDFDFFIITSANRLWLCRTILHLFKKLTFLVGKQHHFCMNYFIDESNFELEDKNVFVAYEIATLLPVYNQTIYDRFIARNAWVKREMPQYKQEKHTLYNRIPWIRTAAEWCLRILPLNTLNHTLMKLTDNRWRHKWQRLNYPMEDYDLAFRTRINISKNHPKNHQKMVLARLSGVLRS